MRCWPFFIHAVQSFTESQGLCFCEFLSCKLFVSNALAGVTVSQPRNRGVVVFDYIITKLLILHILTLLKARYTSPRRVRKLTELDRRKYGNLMKAYPGRFGNRRKQTLQFTTPKEVAQSLMRKSLLQNGLRLIFVDERRGCLHANPGWLREDAGKRADTDVPQWGAKIRARRLVLLLMNKVVFLIGSLFLLCAGGG